MEIAEVRSLQLAVDVQRGAELGWAVGELAGVFDRPVLAHPGFAPSDLDRANQDRFSAPAWAADRVHTEMVAINEVNVGSAGRSVHAAVSLRPPGVAVAGRIIGQIGLGFNNRAAARALRRAANKKMPQQPRRDQPRGRFVEGPGQGREQRGASGQRGAVHLMSATSRPNNRFGAPPTTKAPSASNVTRIFVERETSIEGAPAGAAATNI